MRFNALPATLALAVALAACDDSSTSNSIDDLTNDDLAEVVADAALEDLAVMVGAVPSAGPLGAFGPFGAQGGLGSRSGLERDRSVTFLDADGVEQDAFDELTTASIHVVTTVEGAISRDHFTASVRRHRDMWVTGLAGEETERTWNGTGSSDVERTRISDEHGTRSYDLSGSAAVEGVVRAVDKETYPWPLEGTITRQVRVEIVNGPNGDEVRERTTVLTFNGTQYATLVIDGEEYEVDLAARQSERASRRKGGS